MEFIREISIQMPPFLMAACAISMLTGRTPAAGNLKRLIPFPAAAALTWLPIFPSGVSLAGIILGASPLFSVPGTLLFMDILLKRTFRRQLLPERETVVLCGLLIVLSALLTISGWGFMHRDIYAEASGQSAWRFIPAIIAAVSALSGLFRLSAVFLVCAMAFLLRLNGSTNVFDYMTDGAAVVVSAFIIIRRFINR